MFFKVEYLETVRGTGLVEAESYKEALALAIAKEMHFNDDEAIEEFEILKLNLIEKEGD